MPAVGVARMTSQSTLEFRAITKQYGPITAVDGVNLTVARGELLTLLGPSGSGKTTLLKMLAGFEIPDRGDIVLNGREISVLPPAQRNIGMVFQHYALFPHLTVIDNIAYGLRFRGIGKAERRKRAERMLELVRLGGYGQRFPRQLSGGQQQRVAIARALAIEPAVLLMDEPLGALDRQLRREMEQEIRRLHHALDTTIIYVTHDQEEAMTLSDRVAIMRNGKLAGLGAPRALYESPPNAFIARFFGNANVLPVDILRRDGNQLSIRCLGSTFDTRADHAAVSVVGVVNPSAFSLVPTTKPEIRIPVRIEDAVFLGDTVQLVCAPTETQGPAALTVRLPVARAGSAKVADLLNLFVAVDDMQIVAGD